MGSFKRAPHAARTKRVLGGPDRPSWSQALCVTVRYHMIPNGDTMRYQTPLNGLLFNSTATRVLRVLLTTPQRPQTGRQIARLAKTVPHRTSQVLARFQGEGLVGSQVAGSAYLWTLRDGHPLVPALRSLFAAERAATEMRKELLRRALRKVGGVRRAVVFGSAARGDEHDGSDLDILVVAKNRAALERIEEKLASLRLDLADQGGLRISPLVYTVAEFERKRNLPVIRAAESEGEDLIA